MEEWDNEDRRITLEHDATNPVLTSSSGNGKVISEPCFYFFPVRAEMGAVVTSTRKTDFCQGFEELPHTADAALRVWGQDLRELFTHAARGLAWLMADPETVPLTLEIPLDLHAPDAETLLVTWLGELIYLHEREGAVFTEFDLEEVTPTHLRGRVRGGPPGEARRWVKAATFSNLAIRPGPYGLETQVVFDV